MAFNTSRESKATDTKMCKTKPCSVLLKRQELKRKSNLISLLFLLIPIVKLMGTGLPGPIGLNVLKAVALDLRNAYVTAQIHHQQTVDSFAMVL